MTQSGKQQWLTGLLKVEVTVQKGGWISVPFLLPNSVPWKQTLGDFTSCLSSRGGMHQSEAFCYTVSASVSII